MALPLPSIPITQIIALLLFAYAVRSAWGERDVLPDRLRTLRAGWRGFLFTPVTFIAALGTFFVVDTLISLHPWLSVLRWGWLGENLVFSPFPEEAAASGSISPLLAVYLGVFFVVLVFLMVLFVYSEERLYRDSWRDVVIWAVLHLIMGIPIFAVIPIFAAGVVFKTVHDRLGFEEAYACHLGFNLSLIGLLALAVTLLALL